MDALGVNHVGMAVATGLVEVGFHRPTVIVRQADQDGGVIDVTLLASDLLHIRVRVGREVNVTADAQNTRLTMDRLVESAFIDRQIDLQ